MARFVLNCAVEPRENSCGDSKYRAVSADSTDGQLKSYWATQELGENPLVADCHSIWSFNLIEKSDVHTICASIAPDDHHFALLCKSYLSWEIFLNAADL